MAEFCGFLKEDGSPSWGITNEDLCGFAVSNPPSSTNVVLRGPPANV